MSSKYPDLEEEFGKFIPTAKKFGIDLTQANETVKITNKFGSRFGQANPEINLDLTYSIYKFNKGQHEKFMTLRGHVINDLDNWGYESNEIAEALAEMEIQIV